MPRKSFLEQMESLGLRTDGIITFLKGKTLEVIGNRSSHNYGGIGTRFEVQPTAYTGGTSLSGAIPGGNNIRFDEFSVILEETIEDMEKSIDFLEGQKDELDKEIESLKSRIAFMEENAINTYDEDQFKIFQTLKTLEETSTTNLEKAKTIAELIRG